MAAAHYYVLPEQRKGRRRTEGSIHRVSLEEHIKYCLRAAILTQQGERPLYPHVGSQVHNLLFRPLNSALQTDIRNKVAQAISESEPRVEVLETELTPSATDKSQLHLTLKYRIKETQKIDKMKMVVKP